MSSWKKASKVNQRVHQERHQPSNRTHLGLLEKHKDYVFRAKDYQRKQATLKKLKEQALNRNPDEYYHHMVKTQLLGGSDFVKLKPQDTLEQKQIMETKDLNYVNMKLNMERKLVEKLQSEIHLINDEINVMLSEQMSKKPTLIPDLKVLIRTQKSKEKSYRKLARAIERYKQLSIIKNKMEVQKQLNERKNTSKPKLIVAGSKKSAPIYEWKFERKR